MLKKALDRLFDRLRMVGPEALADGDNHIYGGAGPRPAGEALAQERAVAAVEFPDNAFDPIALDRAFFSVHTDAEPGFSKLIGQVNQTEPMPSEALAMRINFPVFPGFGEQAGLGKRMGGHGMRPGARPDQIPLRPTAVCGPWPDAARSSD